MSETFYLTYFEFLIDLGPVLSLQNNLISKVISMETLKSDATILVNSVRIHLSRSENTCPYLCNLQKK